MENRRARRIDRLPAWKGRFDPCEVECLDLADPTAVQRLVCAGFCTFYGSSSADEAGCAGLHYLKYVFAEVARPSAVRDAKQEIRRIVRGKRSVPYDRDDLLDRLICADCGYRKGGDCDHRNPALRHSDRLEPCGGYVVAAFLLSDGGSDLSRVAAGRDDPGTGTA